MKATLIPVEQHTSRAILETALAVARAFDSYLEGLPLGQSVPGVIFTDVGTLPILDPLTIRSGPRTPESGSKFSPNFLLATGASE